MACPSDSCDIILAYHPNTKEVPEVLWVVLTGGSIYQNSKSNTIIELLYSPLPVSSLKPTNITTNVLVILQRQSFIAYPVAFRSPLSSVCRSRLPGSLLLCQSIHLYPSR